MLKLISASVVSAAIGCGATVHAVTTTVAAPDACQMYGYTHCKVIDGVSRPETTDPKLRAQMTKHIRQMVRDRSRG